MLIMMLMLLRRYECRFQAWEGIVRRVRTAGGLRRCVLCCHTPGICLSDVEGE
jgi:hypothetical protein